MVREVVCEKRLDLALNAASTNQDLIASLLSIRDVKNQEAISENEIVHSVMLNMAAGYDTLYVVVTFIMGLMTSNNIVYKAILQEQEDVRKNKPLGEPLSWDDLDKMKHAWRVSLEEMRTIHPIFGGFRKALKDIEYGGYLIPKGWQER